MDLHCTLVRSPGSELAESPVELTISAVDGCSGTELDRELSYGFGTRRLTVNGLPLPSLTVGRAPLVNGAVIVDGTVVPQRPGKGPAADVPASLLLAVHSGPGAGTVLPLRRGSYRIGRATVELTIPDADLSREHARIDVSETALTIEDLDSANGTEVDGKIVRNAVISTSSLIRCGCSTMSILVAGPPGSRKSGLSSAGQSVAEPLTVPRRAGQEKRAALFLSAALPVAIGVGLALLTGMWMYLTFTAVSAVTLLIPVATGRRQRRELRAAVAAASAQDEERRRRSAPSAALLALDAAGLAKQHGILPETSGVWLRLGLSRQEANVRLEPADPEFRPPPLGPVPLLLDPVAAVVAVRGPGAEVSGLMRSFLMQLTGYPLARGTRIAVYAPLKFLPLAARFLPAVTLHAASDHVEVIPTGTLAERDGPGVLMVAGTTDVQCLDQVIERARSHGWRVIRFTESRSGRSDADIELGERQAWFRSAGSVQPFIADLVPQDAFDQYCRQLGQAHSGRMATALSVPTACPLSSILDLSAEATALRWARGSLGSGLAVPIGCGTDGPRILDIEADGPHILIAGTTGSGKSELLRSLTVALALSYPPDRVNILFFDFKGGSGLGPLTELPHCVGMLTDLTRSELDRAMASLRAEVRRREELLAGAQTPDLAAYRQARTHDLPPLPQLILIIDEFRMLVDDAPDSLNELMRIATIGRSLGIHLVMATQRPQGALNADIRANVTTSIALRVQSAHESADIIGSNAAAAIAVETPGRAYLARGTQEPEEFHGAALSLASPGLDKRVVVRRAGDAIEMSGFLAAEGGRPSLPSTPAAAVRPLVDSTRALWAARGTTAVHSPVAPPLPVAPTYPRTAGQRNAASPADTSSASSAAQSPPAPEDGDGRLELGWLDLPHEQRVIPLSWHPVNDGHLAVLGGPSGDVAQAMALALGELATHPAESHIYVLDADGSFSGLESSSRAGAVVGLHEVRRGVRVLERLCGEMSRRLSGAATTRTTPLVVAISGWGSWVAAWRSGPLMWAEDLVHNIVRDGRRAGITAIISGDRELATSRFLSAIPNRVYFPRGATDESRFTWPKMPELPAVPGRAMAFGAIAGGDRAVCQIHASDGRFMIEGEARATLHAPFKVEPLPAHVPLGKLLALLDRTDSTAADATLHGAEPVTTNGSQTRDLYIGVGGDELSPVAVRLPPGGVLAILGGAGMGKTTLLAAIPVLNQSVADWLCPGPERDRADYWAGIFRAAVEGRLAKDAVLLVDDADLLPAPVNQQLLELNTLGWAVILTSGYGQALVQRIPLAMNARHCGSGILIAPRSPMDGDLFGTRFELEPNPPPGRAVLLASGRAVPVQLAGPNGPLGTTPGPRIRAREANRQPGTRTG
ncbi:FtsK/SpoIIIE domain-containing protein [Arthrobacter sp. ISL-28]|uniref:FtsK/SpoIIIE domain-containing protein n=1 Tax=Arthrobacter sp. ISL-28 TaxID=2819108 RepID=UPI001BE9DC74|nr:FtsK/SpoIIIE domain-containing protein [Arthrobacter sp. ISL-28]MBT2522728.1 FHA domain-containing protein [Arthrobacter sp. ISL-28]